MEKIAIENKTIKDVFKAASLFKKLTKFFVDYDKGADVLYISFIRPQKATDSIMRDDGILLRYRGKKLVGMTILDYSKRKN